MRTKIARADKRGRNTVENIMKDHQITESTERERVWASIPSTPKGNTESASTHSVYDENILRNEDEVKPIFEMAKEVWQSKLAKADDIDDISEVFREVFKENIPSSGSPYFKDTYTSQVVSLDKLVAREPADPDRVKHAHEYMVAAREGSGEKRKPISVIDMGNGKFKVLDGNTTLQALRELGETEAVVEVKKSLKQQVADPKSLDDVYQNAEKALPDFKAWIERYAADTKAAKVMMRPGLKGKERAAQKVANDYGGVAARLTDVIGATLLYDSVDQVAAVLNRIGKDPAVFKVKNRYENPTPDGYRDVLMVVQVGGHLCELQLNTQAMLDAKEKGLGHKIYEIIRQIEPLTKAPDFENESDMTALGYMQSLRNLSVKVYRNAAMSSSSSSASSMASDSEMGLEFNRILARLSSSSTTFQVSGLRESIRKMLPVDFSMAKGESSFSTKSNSRFMDVPPFDAGNITRNGQKVKAKLETGKKDQVYLNNDTPLVVQWAVVEADDLVSSHDTDFRLNPEFPQELQPRDRTREEMKKQIFSISGKLNPELLGQSLYASAGAPIVGRDLVVESGNGRMLGLKMRYAQDGATAYREWVGENAKQFGIDPKTIDAMQRPVLVRIRLSEQDRKMVTERANERDIAAMSPVETAKVDSGRLQPEDMELFRPGDDGEIATAANNDFISQFLKTIGPAESAGLLTADGKPARQLLDRIQAAVFEKAYHDERLLALMAEDANPDIRNVLKALTMASTVFAKVKGMVGDKEPIEAIDHIVGAVDVIRRAKREGENVETILNQFGLFGEDIPEETASVTRFLVKNARSAKRIGEFLQAVAKKYQYWAANQDQPDLFGNLPEKPVAGTVLKEALAETEVGGGKQQGLFEDIFESPITDNDVSVLYDETVSNKTSNTAKRVIYRAVTDKEAERIQNETGLDIFGYHRMIDNFAIRHIDNQHGKQKGDLSVTKADIFLIDKIIDQYDSVEAIKTRLGKDGLLYKKKMGNNYFFVEEIWTGRKVLSVKSLYKSPSGRVNDILEECPLSNALGVFPTGDSDEKIMIPELEVKPLFSGWFYGTIDPGQLERKREEISTRGGRSSTGPANPILENFQPLTQGPGTPFDVRPPATDAIYFRSISKSTK